MPQHHSNHPFVDLVFPGALMPQLGFRPGHEEDPPPLLPAEAPARDSQALAVVAMLCAADRDCREDRWAAAEAQLGLAETQLQMAWQHGSPVTPAMEAMLVEIRLARQEVAQHNCRRACAAIASGVRAWAAAKQPQ